jgi:ketosteroid isomerase-like protein
VARPDYYGNPAGLSEEIALVKAIYEAFAERDGARLTQLFSDDCVLQFEGTAKLVGRTGPYLRDVAQVWDGLVLHADDFRAVPGSVIVMGHITGHRQGLDVRRSAVWTWKVAQGRATSVKAADLGDLA